MNPAITMAVTWVQYRVVVLVVRSGMPMQHDDLFRVVHSLGASHAPRHATSLAEAQAAASADGWLRRVGMGVSADPFDAPVSLTFTYALPPLIGLFAIFVAGWLPLPAALFALAGLTLSLLLACAPQPPIYSLQRPSQNIVGTRTCTKPYDVSPNLPRWRIILLAPLDTPTELFEQHPLVGRQPRAVVLRLLAFILLLFLIFLLLIDQQLHWWYVQSIPALYFVRIVWWLVWPSDDSPIAPIHGATGALAVLLAVADQVRTVRSVEVWAVALGATSTSHTGLTDLLSRYPFSPDQTIFVVLEHIEGPQLSYLAREGLFSQWRADPTIRQLFTTLRSHDRYAPPIARHPHRSPTIAEPLHHHGFRVITLRADEQPPTHRFESSAIVEKRMRDGVEQTTRLVVRMIQHLDAEVSTE